MPHDSFMTDPAFSINTSSASHPLGDNSSDMQEFMCLVQDISGYFKMIKNMGTGVYDISRESADMMKTWDIAYKSVSGRDRLDVIDRRASEGLSFLSLHGSGNPHADLFFIICNKQRTDEKLTGVYQGDAGELFLKILKAMKLDKDSVYTSCIKIPDQKGNQREISMEMDTCINFVKEQIDSVCPEIICCLGDIAFNAFLGPEHSLSASRGRFYDYKGIKVMPTFHPASLLMDPSKKRYVWDDMQTIMGLLGISNVP